MSLLSYSYCITGISMEGLITQYAVWADLFPPYFVKFSCHTQSMPAKICRQDRHGDLFSASLSLLIPESIDLKLIYTR